MTSFFINNRFMYIFYVWAIICLSMVFINPYVNMIIFFFGVPTMVFAFCYVQERCKLNKEEEKFISILENIFK